MSNFENPLPEWNAEGIEPPQNKKNEGWKEGDKPPAPWHNWWMYTSYQALKEMRDYLDELEIVTKWEDIEEKPETFPPSSHNHAISDVTNLQEELNKKETPTGAQEKATKAKDDAIEWAKGFGLGSPNKVTDFNGLDNGFYYAEPGADNAPNSGGYFVVFVSKKSSNAGSQIALERFSGGDSKAFIRGIWSGNYGDWKELETTEGAQEKIDDHANKKDNPHKVTKTQVGLGNVNNTKQASEASFNTHKDDGSAHDIGDKSTLETTEKSTIVGALNELFTNVSDGKQLIGGAITDVDEDVEVPTDATFEQLASAIGNIVTGTKWAHGTTTSSQYSTEFHQPYDKTNDQRFVEVTGLDFTPSTVVISRNDTSPLNNITVISTHLPNHEDGYPHIRVNNSYYLLKGNAEFVEGGFTLPYGTALDDVNWVAYE